MATYAIGDIQGCYDEFRSLLDHIKFDSTKDTLWLVGDLVSRGPQSLAVLRFVKSLGKQAITVLGNHDMHLLAVWQGNRSHYRDDSLDQVLAAPDCDELLNWLRHRPLLHYSQKKNYVLIHAGLPPEWKLKTAMICAKEVEQVLQGDYFIGLMKDLYCNQPNQWDSDLTGINRWRFIINCFTRLRYCYPDGTLNFKEKGPPGSQASELMPWFDVPNRESENERIIFGHWSTLGLVARNNVWALDTGCLWGGKLSALRVRKRKPMSVFQVDCPNVENPLNYK